ncbi:hypothetical protein SCACP_18920 [Sporomusa carbonis]|uniref:DUF2953 domain-containing protein n=1 Tax=Sporomusa carbonis TaxID=3076075 RepID=UPI003A727A92
MNNWLIVITSAVILVLLLSRVNLYIDFQFCRRSDDDYVAVTVYIFRQLLVYTIKIPVIQIVRYNDVPWLNLELEGSSDHAETNVDREQQFVKRFCDILLRKPKKLNRLIKTVNNFLRLYRRFVDRMVANVHCEKLDFKAVYGFEDAAWTGMAMGVFGALRGVMLTRLYNRLTFDTKPNIKITPVYGENRFEVEFRCIFRIRLGNVITATMAILPNSMHREATRSG